LFGDTLRFSTHVFDIDPLILVSSN